MKAWRRKLNEVVEGDFELLSRCAFNLEDVLYFRTLQFVAELVVLEVLYFREIVFPTHDFF